MCCYPKCKLRGDPCQQFRDGALCERLELALPEGSGERDEVAKWLKKFEKPEWRDEWATREAEMFSAAKKMERSLLVMLSSMLEGDAEHT